jgi:hypothetical protein
MARYANRNSDKISALAVFLAEKPVMSRLAIALVVALAATAANAQDTKSGQSDTPAAKGTQPFLFDGRMPGDGVRRGAVTNDHHHNAGAVVMPPKASQPGRDR